MKKYYTNLLRPFLLYLSELGKKLRYTLLFSVVLVLFIDAITRAFINYVANPILSKFTSSGLSDMIFYIMALWLIFSFIKKVRRGYYVSGPQVLLSFLILAFYSYFRFLYAPHLFRALHFVNFVKYTDILLLIFSGPVFLKLAALFKIPHSANENNGESTFTAVKAIKKKSQDILGRAARAERLSVEIRNYKANESLAVGVVGEWGSGKTSFVNMVKESLAENNDTNILIDFNPWLNISVGSIIEDYFKTLEKAVEGYSVDVARTIRQYAQIVLGLHKNDITDSILRGADLMLDVSLTERFERLNSLLKKLGRRVYIFIDDFDRLQSDEIFETLKLIRNTAGFDSFTYVVAYDREYLIKSLETHGIPKPESFSEKIFQLEIEMLPATKDQIHGQIMRSLETAFPQRQEEVNEVLEARYKQLAPFGALKNVTSPLRNIRDVERFLNTFIPDYKQVVDEVCFRDYFILKLIKFRYSTVYTFLFSYKDDFIYLEDYNGAQGKTPQYKVKRVDDKDNGHGKHYFDVFKGSELEAYLTYNFNYTNVQLQEIGTLINNLFFHEQKKETLSIAYETNYTKYFRDELSKGNLSLMEFKTVMQTSYHEIKRSIEKWFAEGKGENAYFFLTEKKVWELETKTEFENYIRAMFYIGSFPKDNLHGGQGFFGFDNSKLSYNIDDSRGEIAKHLYNNNTEELAAFIESLFAEAQYPYLFESSFCHYMERYGYGYTSRTFSKEQRWHYQLYYFKAYCDSITVMDNIFWNLYHNCKIGKYDERENGTYITYVLMDEAKEVFKNFTLKNLDNVLVRLISNDTDYGYSEAGLTGVSKQVNIVFGGVRGLIDFLQSDRITEEVANSSLFREEFIKYLVQLEEEGKMVAFNFTFPAAAEKVLNFTSSKHF